MAISTLSKETTCTHNVSNGSQTIPIRWATYSAIHVGCYILLIPTDKRFNLWVLFLDVAPCGEEAHVFHGPQHLH